jgi:hypothetical protein
MLLFFTMLRQVDERYEVLVDIPALVPNRADKNLYRNNTSIVVFET